MTAKKAGGGSGNTMAAKRIKKEIADLSKENLGAITLTPNESNIFTWKATLPGPAGSPYEGGVFDIDIRIPEDYPFSPPHLHFATKVYHCNVAHTGAICLDLLKSAWSPALSLYKVILSLSSLLTDPNPSDPLVPAIAQEYKKNRAKHDATAREWVKLYAQPKVPAPAASASTHTAKAPRPKAISRFNSNTSIPAATVAGTRRPNPYSSTNGSGSTSTRAIDLVGSDSDSEVLGESSTDHARPRDGADGDRDRPTKRTKASGSRANGPSGAGAGGGSDDVIVIDD